MAFVNHDFEFSNIENKKKDYALIPAGNRHVKIIKAEITVPEDEHGVPDKSKTQYSLTIEDLETKAKAFPTFYIYATNNTTGEIFYNTKTKGSLLSLGRALAGPKWPETKYPNPKDIIGGIVLAEITHKDYEKRDGTAGTTAKAYAFHAPLEEFVVESEIAQYYEGASDEEIEGLLEE